MICRPRANVPIVRGSGVDVKAVAGRDKEAPRACMRFNQRVFRADQLSSSDTGVALPLRPLIGPLSLDDIEGRATCHGRFFR